LLPVMALLPPVSQARTAADPAVSSDHATHEPSMARAGQLLAAQVRAACQHLMAVRAVRPQRSKLVVMMMARGSQVRACRPARTRQCTGTHARFIERPIDFSDLSPEATSNRQQSLQAFAGLAAVLLSLSRSS
jgi:D-aminopeptidase